MEKEQLAAFAESPRASGLLLGFQVSAGEAEAGQAVLRRERERERGTSRVMGEGLPEGSLRVLGSSGNRVEFKGSASEATYCL